MILVDTSVWIDFFNGVESGPVQTLDRLLGNEPLAIGDLILVELLQGFSSDRDFEQARRLAAELIPVQLGGHDVAVRAADNYRALRTRGVTIRKTIDTVIATWCILRGHALLHNDRDFEPFETHLGLRTI